MPITDDARALLANQVTLILGTASASGQPNLAPMGLYWLTDDDRLVFGDLWLKTVVEHIRVNPQVQVCFWEEDTNKTFKLNGTATYVVAGPEFDLARDELGKAGESGALKGAVVLTLDD